MEIADLVSLMSNVSAYVNVHTEIYPDGAIRAQIGSEEQGATIEGGSSSLTTDGNTSSSTTEQSSTTEESSSITKSSDTTS
jgi:hypothetical protein